MNPRNIIFIPLRKVNKIKEKYDNSFHDFLDYFNKTDILHEPYNDKSLNYASFYKRFSDKDLFFSQIIYVKVQIGYLICILFLIEKHFIHLKNVYWTLEYFKNKEDYEEKGIQMTRALHNYVNNNYNHDRLPLISSKDIKNMLEEYKRLKNINHINHEITALLPEQKYCYRVGLIFKMT